VTIVDEGGSSASVTDELSGSLTARDDTYSGALNSTLSVEAAGVLANDSDPAGAPLTAELVSPPAEGTLHLNGDGSFTYEPLPGYAGDVTFTYRANNGTALSNVATVTLSFSPRVDIVGHQVGTVFGPGAEVAEEDEDDPTNLLMGAKDQPDQTLDSTTTGLVELTLKSLQPLGVTAGTLELTVNQPDAVRVFKEDGTPLHDYVVDLANPQGDLAGLAQQDVNVFVEALTEEDDLQFVLSYQPPAGESGGGGPGGKDKVDATSLPDLTKKLHVDRINYKNPTGKNDPKGNVNLVIDGMTKIGSPGNLNATDTVEWDRKDRSKANSTAAWSTDQAAPAAFIKGSPMTALVGFSSEADNLNIVSITVKGVNGGSYGDFLVQKIAFTGKSGSGWFQTAVDKALGTVDVNDVTFKWQVVGMTVLLKDKGKEVKKDLTLDKPIDLESSTNRIYTLYAAPLAPMQVPWATVLEVAAGMAKGQAKDTDILAVLTKGIHQSAWRDLGRAAHFLEAKSILGYNLIALCTEYTGGPDRQIIVFQSEKYDLDVFMSYLGQKAAFQQCADNANLLAVFSRSLGVPLGLLSLVHKWPVDRPGDRLNPATFYPAGSTVRINKYQFNGHQFAFLRPPAGQPLENGKVYDPSLRNDQNGDPPYVGVSLKDYLDSAFPGQRQAGYQTQTVNTLTIGKVKRSPFIFETGVARAKIGATTTVTLEGAGLNDLLTLIPAADRMGAENGQVGFEPTVAGRYKISEVKVISPTRLTFKLTVAADAPAGEIYIVGTKTGDELAPKEYKLPEGWRATVGIGWADSISVVK
jgi:hypothetical protein